MVRISSAAASLVIFVVLSISTEAFSPSIANNGRKASASRSSSILAVGVLPEDDDVDDFDAPILADPVMSGKVGELDHDPIVDDECYLGKDNLFDECIDFDPIHNVKVAKDSDVDFKLPDFSKIGEEISSALKESIGKFINK